ncbi:hypothetical protein PT974_11345 [Cladobotryum mycophilum]|uniref:Mediator of RNA polymerase II transcription subunit 1 n=1 Tax=Cladobotryum mycophilum TaxID=491253 RepID=A0ABR0S4Y4_9HYPO
MGALVSGGFDIGLDGVGGLDTLGVGYGTEDDKLKRLDTILKLLNQKKGFVSEAGLERLAQRLGLELLSEEHATPGGRKTKTLAIAGSAISLDIVLDNNIVQSVSLAYHGSAPSVSKHMEEASQILLRDLQLAPNQSPLTKTLDEFASNFEQIATLDKLSIVPGLDCYEALAGIHVSLERLFQWDISKLREDPSMSEKSDKYLSLAAMCSRNGYPVMHTRGKVGLALQYWRELRYIAPSNDKISSFSDKEEKVWSLLLSCAPIDGLGLPSIRVSEDWISKDIVKHHPTMDPTKPMLDWQEPDNISLPPSEENKDASMEVLQLGLSNVPQVMFTVTFDPPVILPQNDWIRLYSYANATPPNPNASNDFGHRPPPPPPTFDGLFFPIPFGSKQDPSESRTITRSRDVRVFDRDGKSFTRSHKNTLFIYKPIYSQEVTEMPFSHPRQLIDMLPLLRQFAFLSTLLDNSFGPKTKDGPRTSVKAGKPTSSKNSSTTKDQLADFMASSDQSREHDVELAAAEDMDLDVILWVHPAPHLQVVFPMRDSTVNITLRILEGGTVEIVDENVLGQDGNGPAKGKGKQLTRDGLGKVLEHLEDLCKWAEWIRTRLS